MATLDLHDACVGQTTRNFNIDYQTLNTMTIDNNLYEPPKSNLNEVPAMSAMQIADRWRRLGTFIIDYAGFMLFAVVVGAALGGVFGRAGLAVLHKLPKMLTGTLILMTYYLIFEGIWARTPGKWLFRTIVVTESGAKPSFEQILGRTLCRLIPFEAFSCLSGIGWHDKLSKTRVVRYVAGR